MQTERRVAIVSFEGTLKREIKRVREQLKNCKRLPEFSLLIKAHCRVTKGDVSLSYELAEDFYSLYPEVVKGDSLQAVVDEFLRRHGWSVLHAPKVVSYEEIPSDDTTETKEGTPF